MKTYISDPIAEQLCKEFPNSHTVILFDDDIYYYFPSAPREIRVRATSEPMPEVRKGQEDE